MKKLVLILAIGAFVSLSASAQQKDENKKAEEPSISIGVDAALPMGDFADVSKTGFGGTAKFAYPAGPGAITVTAGYISFSGKSQTVNVGGTTMTISGSSSYLIPMKAGYRFNLGQGFGIEPQVGYSVGKNSSGGFTYAGQIGYLINNQIDISARYEGLSKSGTSWSFIGFRVAYNFSLGSK
jgi:outer membrane autotransporter protein